MNKLNWKHGPGSSIYLKEQPTNSIPFYLALIPRVLLEIRLEMQV
jgi:hypothetical protein